MSIFVIEESTNQNKVREATKEKATKLWTLPPPPPSTEV